MSRFPLEVPRAVREDAQRGLSALSKGPVVEIAEEALACSLARGFVDADEYALLGKAARDFPAAPPGLQKGEAATEEGLRWLLTGGAEARRWVDGGDAPRGVAKSVSAQVVKVDEGLGLVLGYAIVCCDGGKPYYDTQGDHIPEDAMMEAATDFMLKGRAVKEMHDGDVKGTVVFAWPLTADVAKAFGMKVKKTGLLIAVKPDDDEVLEKFKSGEYTGFSIGGSRIEDEDEEDA